MPCEGRCRVATRYRGVGAGVPYLCLVCGATYRGDQLDGLECVGVDPDAVERAEAQSDEKR